MFSADSITSPLEVGNFSLSWRFLSTKAFSISASGAITFLSKKTDRNPNSNPLYPAPEPLASREPEIPSSGLLRNSCNAFMPRAAVSSSLLSTAMLIRWVSRMQPPLQLSCTVEQVDQLAQALIYYFALAG